MMHEFIYNGMNSRDFGLTISGEDTWSRPQPDIKRISVPGRNGDLIQLGNRFQNLDITYHCGIIKDLRTNFDAFNARLLSDPGYHRLEDSYHPEYFRMAVFESAQDPNTGDYFIIDCDRQDIYKYGTSDNWNNEFSLLDGEFFELKPGRNQIICSGIQHDTLYITPNWWTV